jgi:hypothetical protein
MASMMLETRFDFVRETAGPESLPNDLNTPDVKTMDSPCTVDENNNAGSNLVPLDLKDINVELEKDLKAMKITAKTENSSENISNTNDESFIDNSTNCVVTEIAEKDYEHVETKKSDTGNVRSKNRHVFQTRQLSVINDTLKAVKTKCGANHDAVDSKMDVEESSSKYFKPVC